MHGRHSRCKLTTHVRLRLQSCHVDTSSALKVSIDANEVIEHVIAGDGGRSVEPMRHPSRGILHPAAASNSEFNEILAGDVYNSNSVINSNNNDSLLVSKTPQQSAARPSTARAATNSRNHSNNNNSNSAHRYSLQSSQSSFQSRSRSPVQSRSSPSPSRKQFPESFDAAARRGGIPSPSNNRNIVDRSRSASAIGAKSAVGSNTASAAASISTKRAGIRPVEKSASSFLGIAAESRALGLSIRAIEVKRVKEQTPSSHLGMRARKDAMRLTAGSRQKDLTTSISRPNPGRR